MKKDKISNVKTGWISVEDQLPNDGEYVMVYAGNYHQSRKYDVVRFEKGSSHTPKAFEESIKDTFEDEIADAVIRLLDLSAGLGIDLEWHIRSKVEYNKNRQKLHGKLY